MENFRSRKCKNKADNFDDQARELKYQSWQIISLQMVDN